MAQVVISSRLQREQSWARSSHPSKSMSRAFMSLLVLHLWIGIGGSPQLSCLLQACHTAGPCGSYHPASCGRVLANDGDVVLAECRCWVWQHIWGPHCLLKMWSNHLMPRIHLNICGKCWVSFPASSTESMTRCHIYIYMTKCQKVRKSWVKILTVNKIWSRQLSCVGVTFRECSEMAPKTVDTI